MNDPFKGALNLGGSNALNAQNKNEVRFITRKVKDFAATGVAQLLIGAPHRYEWLTLDPGSEHYLVVYTSGPSFSPESVTVHPGGHLPISGRSLWVVPVSFSGGVEADSESVFTVWLSTNPATPPALQKSLAGVNQTQDGQYPQVRFAVPGTAEPTLTTEGIPIPSGFDRLTIHFRDNLGDQVIQGAETGEYELWWYDTLWGHNQDDDPDAAGRGSVLRANDLYVYDLGNNFRRVYLRKISGDGFWADFTFSRSGK